MLVCLRSSTGSPGVEIVSLELPALVRLGEDASLTCNYQLLGTGQKLYTVNWWRNGDQFYIYTERAPNKKYSVEFDGIKVDVSLIVYNFSVKDSYPG